MGAVPVSMSAPFIYCVHRGQKRELNPLELPLKKALSCYPGAGN